MARRDPDRCMKLVHLRHPSGEPRLGRVDICGEPFGHDREGQPKHRGIKRGIVWEQGRDPATGERSNKAAPVVHSHGGSTVPEPKD